MKCIIKIKNYNMYCVAINITIHFIKINIQHASFSLEWNNITDDCVKEISELTMKLKSLTTLV